jgi:hypothetical protein
MIEESLDISPEYSLLSNPKESELGTIEMAT